MWARVVYGVRECRGVSAKSRVRTRTEAHAPPYHTKLACRVSDECAAAAALSAATVSSADEVARE